MGAPGESEDRIKDAINYAFRQHGLQIRIERIYSRAFIRGPDGKASDIDSNYNFAYDFENDKDPRERIAAMKIIMDLVRSGML